MKSAIKLLFAASLAVTALAHGDELVKTIQLDLIKLGYEPGNIQGELSTDTVVAISKFQAENGMDVTGEPSPQLAGVIKSKIGAPKAAPTAATGTHGQTSDAVQSHEQLRAAQQACIQEKIQAQQEANEKKRGMNSLLRAATRIAGRFGNNDLYQVAGDVYSANATAADLQQAAEDLGVSEDALEECRNPAG